MCVSGVYARTFVQAAGRVGRGGVALLAQLGGACGTRRRHWPAPAHRQLMHTAAVGLAQRPLRRSERRLLTDACKVAHAATDRGILGLGVVVMVVEGKLRDGRQLVGPPARLRQLV